MDSRVQEDIDAVYTWVSEAGFRFRAERRRHKADCFPDSGNDGCSRKRFRDNGELRFSLRSLAEFAPWVRTIHIVTNGQLPPWLDTCDRRIALVNHREIFRTPESLPVFNSNAIELQLHRIPNLSRRFLYLNDDVFLCRPVDRGEFLAGGGGQYFLLDNIPLHDDRHRGPVHDRAYAHTQLTATSLAPMPAHSPQLYDRDILARLEALFPAEYAETALHPVSASAGSRAAHSLLDLSAGDLGTGRAASCPHASGGLRGIPLLRPNPPSPFVPAAIGGCLAAQAPVPLH